MLFPCSVALRLGLRLKLQKGDALLWPLSMALRGNRLNNYESEYYGLCNWDQTLLSSLRRGSPRDGLTDPKRIADDLG